MATVLLKVATIAINVTKTLLRAAKIILEVTTILLGVTAIAINVTKTLLRAAKIIPEVTTILLKVATIAIKATNDVTKARAIASGQAQALQIASHDKDMVAKNLKRANETLAGLNKATDAGKSLWQKGQEVFGAIAPWLGEGAKLLGL